MPVELAVAQGLVLADAGGPAVVARSADFPFAWENAAVTAAVRFGPRPPGVRCPAAVFAVPVGRSHVAVVQVADVQSVSASVGVSGKDRSSSSPSLLSFTDTDTDTGTDTALGFRFLVLGKPLYEALGDPFAIADRFPPDWSARGTLGPLEWPPEPLPRRTVDQLQRLLKTGDTALLLGGTQALLDGGRLVVEADAPADALFRGLWLLLPARTRCELWPATFAFSTDLGFHAAALPAVPSPLPDGALTADQCRDYPEGRYELAVQTAVESGNQPDLDRQLARRSSLDTLKLAATMLAAAVLIALASKLFS